ncbi:Tox-REase-5 domain-containing protein [Tsukamurella soli]|uniref:Tox-REase-5 domain-containing protein n=1 Tax=Tsukamurella soli TaxID=644556 RepID=A0ABP8J149_9ACTN
MGVAKPTGKYIDELIGRHWPADGLEDTLFSNATVEHANAQIAHQASATLMDQVVGVVRSGSHGQWVDASLASKRRLATETGGGVADWFTARGSRLERLSRLVSETKVTIAGIASEANSDLEYCAALKAVCQQDGDSVGAAEIQSLADITLSTARQQIADTDSAARATAAADRAPAEPHISQTVYPHADPATLAKVLGPDDVVQASVGAGGVGGLGAAGVGAWVKAGEGIIDRKTGRLRGWARFQQEVTGVDPEYAYKVPVKPALRVTGGLKFDGHGFANGKELFIDAKLGYGKRLQQSLDSGILDPRVAGMLEQIEDQQKALAQNKLTGQNSNVEHLIVSNDPLVPDLLHKVMVSQEWPADKIAAVRVMTLEDFRKEFPDFTPTQPSIATPPLATDPAVPGAAGAGVPVTEAETIGGDPNALAAELFGGSKSGVITAAEAHDDAVTSGIFAGAAENASELEAQAMTQAMAEGMAAEEAADE